MNTINDIISDIAVFMYGGMITLPLTIAGTMLIIGLFTANYAMLFFLIGFLVVTPGASCGLDWLVRKGIEDFRSTTYDICKINATKSKESGEPEKGSSTWISMISFFIGYIFTNGISIYNAKVDAPVPTKIDSDKSSPEMKNRKNHAVLGMMSVIVFAMISFGYRYYTKCESVDTIHIVATGVYSIIFTILGVGWYYLLSTRGFVKIPGDNRLADLFGIANRLLGPDAMDNEPMACVPVGVPKCN